MTIPCTISILLFWSGIELQKKPFVSTKCDTNIFIFPQVWGSRVLPCNHPIEPWLRRKNLKPKFWLFWKQWLVRRFVLYVIILTWRGISLAKRKLRCFALPEIAAVTLHLWTVMVATLWWWNALMPIFVKTKMKTSSEMWTGVCIYIYGSRCQFGENYWETSSEIWTGVIEWQPDGKAIKVKHLYCSCSCMHFSRGSSRAS